MVNHISTKKNARPVAVDLFAGGGGLSLGLQQAGYFVCAAVEVESVACATYSANHRGTVLFQRDIRQICGEELIRTSPKKEIDLIAACPPCQGFSSLTSKYRKDDIRNELIFEFVRIVEEIRPNNIMMENVPGLMKKGALLFNKAMSDLKAMGYFLNHDVLNVSDYGVPQTRKRLVVLGSLAGKVDMPHPTHGPGRKPRITVRDAIEGRLAPIKLKDSEILGGPEKVNWNVVRNLTPLSVARLRATKAGASRVQLPEDLRPSCHKGTYAGFSNVYGRMSWDEPSPTITGGCTTLSKGRFGHPSLLRTISVREAALLQSFPESYKLKSHKMERVCDVIGNALPPRFAKAMAKSFVKKDLE